MKFVKPKLKGSRRWLETRQFRFWRWHMNGCWIGTLSSGDMKWEHGISIGDIGNGFPESLEQVESDVIVVG